MRLLLLAGLAVQPVCWFVPPWVGTGQPFLAATHAAEYNGHLGSDRSALVLARGVRDQVLPALILAVVAVAIGWLRDRNRVILIIGAGIAGWWVVVVGDDARRLSGAGALLPARRRADLRARRRRARAAGPAGRRAGRLAAPAGDGGRGRRSWSWLSIPFTTTQISEARGGEPSRLAGRSTCSTPLTQAVAAVGGKAGVLPCRSSFAAVNHSAQTALAWKLHVTLERVGTVDARARRRLHRTQGRPDRRSGEGRSAPHARRDRGGGAGPWRVVRLTDPRLPHGTACVGR